MAGNIHQNWVKGQLDEIAEANRDLNVARTTEQKGDADWPGQQSTAQRILQGETSSEVRSATARQCEADCPRVNPSKVDGPSSRGTLHCDPKPLLYIYIYIYLSIYLCVYPHSDCLPIFVR